MTLEAFNKLLACLDTDREIGAKKYEEIRKRLITFFECRGSLSPEDHCDITINRVTRRISEGAEIHTSEPIRFFFGVARMILHESRNDRSHREIPLDDSINLDLISERPSGLEEQRAQRLEHEQGMDCLEECLETLPPKDKEIIIQYYCREAGAKVNNRRRLAEELGISMTALRIRAMRIRQKLESCIRDCMSRLSGL